MKTLNLQQYHASGTMLLSGRPKGEAIRRELNLDKIDQDDESVRIIVPREIVSMNSSFFLGLFGPSVRSKGEQAFRQKFSFDCCDAILVDVDAGIIDALKTSNPLSRPCER